MCHPRVFKGLSLAPGSSVASPQGQSLLPHRPLAEPTQQSARPLPICPARAELRPQRACEPGPGRSGQGPGLGGRNIPAPSPPQACEDWARPACLPADSGLQEPSPLVPHPPDLLPFQFSSSRAPWAGVGDEEPWQKPRREMKIHLPQTALSRADCETQSQVSG